MKTGLMTMLFCLSAAAGSLGAVEGSQVVAGVSDMAWIAGRWVDESSGDLSEETWGPPSGDCLVGMWRLVVGGKAKLYELLSITAEPDGLVLRLSYRHDDAETLVSVVEQGASEKDVQREEFRFHRKSL